VQRGVRRRPDDPREHPDLLTLFADVATGAGATALTTTSSGGWFDLGLVYNADKSSNSKPTPGAPGNFTCEAAG
jgi:hypothetical protein